MVDELKVSEAAMGGGQTFVHYNGVRTHSVLERLQLQSDMLDSAAERCVAEGGCLPIVEGVQKGAQKTLQEELKVAVAEDEERKAKEAAAAAKAAKKKGKAAK